MALPDIIQMLAKEYGVPVNTLRPLLNAYHKYMRDEVLANKITKFAHFGTFEVRTYLPSIGVNIRTGEDRIRPEKRKLSFRPSATMKNKLEDALRGDFEI